MFAFESLDPRLFRAFLHAAEAASFTAGARRAGMTQSGMSQHIARLEEQLGLPLFERVNKKVLLTPAGRELQRFVESYAESVEKFLEEVKSESAEPRGLVRYAMPSSCLKTPHFPLLLEKRRKFAQVELEVALLANGEIHQRLLSGEIDFGFVTLKSDNPAFHYEPFAEEEYVLVAGEEKWLRELNGDRIGELPFVDYPGMGALFEIWRRQLFPRKHRLSESALQIVGRINHLDGALTMVRHGVGVTIIPRHCGGEFWKKKQLHAYEPPGRTSPVGTIYIITRRGFSAPRRVQRVLQSFWEMKSR